MTTINLLCMEHVVEKKNPPQKKKKTAFKNLFISFFIPQNFLLSMKKLAK